jgi:hypothetical protein
VYSFAEGVYPGNTNTQSHRFVRRFKFSKSAEDTRLLDVTPSYYRTFHLPFALEQHLYNIESLHPSTHLVMTAVHREGLAIGFAAIAYLTL